MKKKKQIIEDNHKIYFMYFFQNMANNSAYCLDRKDMGKNDEHQIQNGSFLVEVNGVKQSVHRGFCSISVLFFI